MSLKARFITFEGGEGTGKTTQRDRLATALRQGYTVAGRPLAVLSTREPGGSAGAELLRDLLVSGDADRWDHKTETLLHFAARRDHLVKTVLPALAAGTWVICDRFFDSTIAYQGFGHGIDRGDLDRLRSFTCDKVTPDLTFVLDLPVSVGLARAGARPGGETRYETMDRSFHQRVRDGFLSIAAQEPNRCRVETADVDADTLHDRILNQVRKAFPDLTPVAMPV